MTLAATTKPVDADRQREQLLEAEREAHRHEPRNFNEEALTDKVVSVEPDGTGPTPTDTFDAPSDRRDDSDANAPRPRDGASPSP